MVEGPSDLFRDSRSKIKRADQHIHELTGIINAFIETNPYKLWVDQDIKTGNQVIKFAVTADAPCETPFVIGDALHNLRTAVDFIASEIVRRANGTTRYIKFPIYETRKEVESAVKNGDMKVAHPTLIAAILDEVRPYDGGNDAIRALHALDISDKHLLPITTTIMSGVTGDFVMGGGVFTNATLRAGRDAQNLISLPAGTHLHGNMRPMFDIQFAKGQGFDLEPVIPTLHQLSQLVSGIVDVMAKAYIASIQPVS